MRRFFIRLYIFTAVLHLLWGVALALVLDLPPIVAALLALGLGAAFHGRLEILKWDRPLPPWRRFVEEAYWAHWCGLGLAAPLTLATAPGLALATAHLDALATPRLWLEALLLADALGLGLALYGVGLRRRWLRIRRIPIAIEGLPPSFAGYRIVQLSDVHLGSLCPRERVARWVAEANALEADLVVLTGDYVTSGIRFHEDIAGALGALRAKDGVYAVMGNHDYFGDGEPLMGLMQRAGVRWLRNEHVELARGEARLCLAGVDDIYTGRIDIPAALEGRDEDLPLLVLAHDPRSFRELARRGASLVLSGHTHWGQVALPWFASRVNYNATFLRYHAGHYRLGEAQLYVHPGLGTTGPPLRIGTWPEIAVLELREG
ncbi:MAG: metallophosphoesterase [Myxococcales bacterium]|nr:metallophosphoesterase [Myxococcales bacterium]